MFSNRGLDDGGAGDLDVDWAAALADFLDWGRDDGHAVGGMVKFKMHAAADEAEFEHGASPGGSGDGDQDGLGAIERVAGDVGVVIAEHDGGVGVVLGIDLQDGPGRQAFEKDPAFDFRLDNIAVHRIAQIRVGRERE